MTEQMTHERLAAKLGEALAKIEADEKVIRLLVNALKECLHEKTCSWSTEHQAHKAIQQATGEIL